MEKTEEIPRANDGCIPIDPFIASMAKIGEEHPETVGCKLAAFN